MLYEVITLQKNSMAIEKNAEKKTEGGGGSVSPELVITSYSIHYTKLYDGLGSGLGFGFGLTALRRSNCDVVSCFFGGVFHPSLFISITTRKTKKRPKTLQRSASSFGLSEDVPCTLPYLFFRGDRDVPGPRQAALIDHFDQLFDRHALVGDDQNGFFGGVAQHIAQLALDRPYP